MPHVDVRPKSGGSASLTLEARRLVGEAGEPAFEHSWKNAGEPFEPCTFYKDPLGFVHIEGVVESGEEGKSIFTLPVGFRPKKERGFTCIQAGEEMGKVQIMANGEVFALNFVTFLYLDTISFRAAGS
jgi:hypothetical protein